MLRIFKCDNWVGTKGGQCTKFDTNLVIFKRVLGFIGEHEKL